MGLTCECIEWEGEGWAYIEPDNFSTLQKHKRQRCKSCKVLIEKGQTCLEFKRLRYPTEFELEKLRMSEDDEIFLPSYFMCESCGDQFFNLTALGFCPAITDNMFDLLKEYHEIYLISNKGTLK